HTLFCVARIASAWMSRYNTAFRIADNPTGRKICAGWPMSDTNSKHFLEGRRIYNVDDGAHYSSDNYAFNTWYLLIVKYDYAGNQASLTVNDEVVVDIDDFCSQGGGPSISNDPQIWLGTPVANQIGEFQGQVTD